MDLIYGSLNYNTVNDIRLTYDQDNRLVRVSGAATFIWMLRISSIHLYLMLENQ